jgi:hypothetical protein
MASFDLAFGLTVRDKQQPPAGAGGGVAAGVERA